MFYFGKIFFLEKNISYERKNFKNEILRTEYFFRDLESSLTLLNIQDYMLTHSNSRRSHVHV